MLTRYASAVLNIAGSLTLLLGLLFWGGLATNFVSLHMLLGLLTVAALWVIAGSEAVQRGKWLFAATALILGVLTIFVGLRQTAMMPGPSHWIIQVIHLLLGVFTIGMGHMGKKNG